MAGGTLLVSYGQPAVFTQCEIQLKLPQDLADEMCLCIKASNCVGISVCLFSVVKTVQMDDYMGDTLLCRYEHKILQGGAAVKEDFKDRL